MNWPDKNPTLHTNNPSSLSGSSFSDWFRFPSLSRQQGQWLLGLWILGLSLRLAVALGLPNSFLQFPATALNEIPLPAQLDPDSYLLFAQRWWQFGNYGVEPDIPSAFRPPGYPLLLIPGVALGQIQFWILTLHLLAAHFTLWGTWRLAQFWFRVADGPVAVTSATTRSNNAAIWALAVVAVEPLLLAKFTTIMTETVFVAAFVWLLLAWWERWSAWRLGALLTLAFYLRPTALIFWFVWTLTAYRDRQQRRWAWATTWFFVGILPWVGRNALLWGVFLPMTSHGGYTLWLGHNPEFYQQVVVSGASVWPEASFASWTEQNYQSTRHLPELAKDRYFQQQAWQWMYQHPAAALQTAWHHAVSLWSWRPRSAGTWAQRLCLGFYSVQFMLIGLGLISSLRYRQLVNYQLDAFLSCLALTALHLLYWSDPRMRIPLLPILAIWTAQGIQVLQNSWSREPRH